MSGAAAEDSADTDCDAAAARTGQQGGVPEQLLRSIERVESAGQPWAVNVDGQGHSFATKQDAIAFVQAASTGGARFIDVGCFQIDLHYHPDAFADLQTAFDPVINAGYAARFLISLRGNAADWNDAVAAYHSGDPLLGRSYRDRVFGVSGTQPAPSSRGWHAAGWTAGPLVIEPGSPPQNDRFLPRVFVP